MKYLNLLAEKYPNIQAAMTEIVNLEAILNLPKGTEHFISDLHGEDEAFLHILNNASGVIRAKIDDVFSQSLTETQKRSLATLIYYPLEKLELLKVANAEHLTDFYKVTLHQLVEICRVVSSKYTRSKIRKALPKDFAYIIDELINYQDYRQNKEQYYENIVSTIIDIDCADSFIYAICEVIKKLAVDHLHVVGDIFDRGPGPDIVMEALMGHHSVDIQWGNHDILWMGAAAGHDACIANVIRISLRYNHMAAIEEGYGINLLPLATFAMRNYSNTNVEQFVPKNTDGMMTQLAAIMHKAVSVIQFKLEGHVIKAHPEYEMDDRLLLNKINYENKTINIGGVDYELSDCDFPTIIKEDPYRLTTDEQDVVDRLRASFKNSKQLQKHIHFIFNKGGIYLKYNDNLLFHGCVPLNEKGDFETVVIEGQAYKGIELFEKMENIVRRGFYAKEGSTEKQKGMDMMWYLWNGPKSPLFGKDKMATLERYVVKDKATHKEKNNAYFKFRDTEEMCNKILEEFSLSTCNSRIINGHVPVHAKENESPIKAGGKLMDIDGGLSKAYQSVTGIAGYTLIYNSYGMKLVSHEPFVSRQTAIEKEIDIHSTMVVQMRETTRKRVSDTDTGLILKRQITDLMDLLNAYRSGSIKEKF